MQGAVQDRGGGARTERGAPRRGQREDRAQGEHIGGGARFAVTRQLFRSDETGRADRLVGGGQALVGRALRDAEVEDLGAVTGDEDVRRLQVAVREPHRVHPGQRLREGRAQRGEFGRAEGPVRGDGGRQIGTRAELRGEPRPFGIRIGVEHRRGEGARDGARGDGLTAEPLPELGLHGQVFMHRLDGREPTRRGTRQMHTPHPALAEPRHDPEPAELDRLTPRGLCHAPASPSASTTPPDDLCDACESSYGCTEKALVPRKFALLK